MNKLKYIFLLLAASLSSISCSDEMREQTAFPEGEPVSVCIGINVGEMSAAQITKSSESSSPDTKASEPMAPGQEKYVRTMAIFEFDNEGLHAKSSATYHFIDFIAGTVDGETGIVEHSDAGVVRTNLQGIVLESRSNGTLCLVANVSPDDVSDFYENYKTEGQSVGNVSLDSFMQWSLPFEYKFVPFSAYEDNDKVSGHIETMYMFGYYRGRIDASAPGDISVDLGRLASRLDITVINETGRELDQRFGYHFDNMCREAYIFPTKISRPPVMGSGLSRTVICSGEELIEGVEKTFPSGSSHTRYFYAAAHSAANENEASKLHLIYGGQLGEDDVLGGNGMEIQIPLCNVHPSVAALVKDGYSLSRNTCYAFTFRLKSASAQMLAQSQPDVQSQSHAQTLSQPYTQQQTKTQPPQQTESFYIDDESSDIIIYLP